VLLPSARLNRKTNHCSQSAGTLFAKHDKAMKSSTSFLRLDGQELAPVKDDSELAGDNRSLCLPPELNGPETIRTSDLVLISEDFSLDTRR
jgi:hypothetical protein